MARTVSFGGPVAVLALLVLAIVFASPAVAENTFRESDANAFVQLDRTALALSKDMHNSTHILGQSREFDQAQCLGELENVLRSTEDALSSAHDLVSLSAQMMDPMDEALVNLTLADNASIAVRQLAESRRYALSQGSLCSTSAVVNTYAQKVAAITDSATVLFDRIRGLLPRRP
jgi:hypothetical protein